MISPATIAAVKERASIEDLVSEVTSLRRTGAALVGLCPLHSEKTPSFSVNPARNYAHCFGCRWGGGPIDFVMAKRGLSFPEAVRELAESLGIEIEEGKRTPQDDAAKREEQSLFAVNTLAATYYETCLWGGTTEPAKGAVYGRAELARRGILSKPGASDDEGRALTAFRVGYAPAAWRGLAAHLERQGFSSELAEKAGLVVSKEGRTYDRFRHRLMFPVLDSLGRVVAFSGRILPEPAPHHRDADAFTVGDKPAKYVNTSETPIYKKGSHLFGLWQGRDAIRAAGEAALVEGNFDVVSLHARGITNVVAPLGTAFTDVQAKLLRRFTGRVVVAFDGDNAGKRATWMARIPVRAARLEARSAALPAGEDPDSLVQKKGAAAFRDVLRHAPPLRERLIEQLLADGDGSWEAKSKRVKAVITMLGEEDDPAVRDMMRGYADRLASVLVVDGRAPASLRDLEIQITRAMRGVPGRDAVTPAVAPPSDAVSFAVVGAVLDVPGVAGYPPAPDVLALLEGDYAMAALAAQRTTAEEVMDATPESLRPHVAARLAAPLYATVNAALVSMGGNARKLWERGALASEGELREKLKAAERAGDETEVTRLLGLLGQRLTLRVGQ